MSRRTLLWLLGAVSAALSVVLLAIDARMWAHGGPGIVGFELAGSRDAARDILAEWGPEGRSAARGSLWVDFAYLMAYGAFLSLAAAAIRDVAWRQRWRRFERAGSLATVAALVAAVLDAAEDVCLLLVLGGHGGSVAPRLAAAFAVAKFALVTAVVVFLVAAVIRRAFYRFALATLAAGALVVVLSGGLLAANARSVTRATERAAADAGGRVMPTPGGGLNVHVDGASGPPVLLIHGFGSSLHWWDGVTATLARDHRVIRVDLLGHGGSEKPRDGYAMEEQADALAAVLTALDLDRATVVGHSMGGLVATALAERHRDRVRRLVLVGTPVERGGSGGLETRMALMPVIGPAIHSLVPQRMLRNRLESGLSPGVDLPGRAQDDLAQMTFTALRRSAQQSDDYRARPVDERLTAIDAPVAVIFGAEDAIVDAAWAERYRDVPGARVTVLPGLGHSPHVEAPRMVARLIAEDG